ncbi:cytochrome P450 [Lasiosphaeris hirsuta]|uniref:Cytochrome P450 n=1 Tax=Lasiosphaeris hirsuta TaxID=260670 RepID=A0AA39ZRS0_9PEZI|nr:cytochrome P450 [Lasiosphaeris hirsuta]
MGLLGDTLSGLSPDQEHLWITAAVAGSILWVGYGIFLAVYRLYLHPLAKFPGPKLAALTQWYEVYYEIVQGGGGQFTFEIKRMHEKYGPIVRINPNELHIDDPDYYDVIYANGKAYDKPVFFQYRFNMPHATFSTADADSHRIRRAAIAPFFSKNKVRDQNRLIQNVVDRISYRLATEWSGTARVIDLMEMWGCMTSDVITELVFARPKHFVESAGLKSEFSNSLSDMVYTTHYMTHFGWLLTVMNALPNWFVKIAAPPFRSVIEFREEMERQIADILAGRNTEAKTASHPTVFHEILSSSLPAEELSLNRLQNEAMSLVGAGDHTTKWAFTVGSFHIIANPDIQKKLKDELTAAIPDPDNIIPWSELEKLPYLSAVVSEALRTSFGVVQRLPRINRFAAWKYGDYEIPPGVPVGMDQYHMHTNPDIFPEPNTFKPERWLGNPTGPDGIKPLSTYMTAFGKGTRMCTGLNMAYAELFIGLATIFRRHEFLLFETDRSDVDFAVDMVSPHPKWGSKGVRALVK